MPDIKKPITEGQKLLLRLLWEKHGGQAAAARIVGLPSGDLNNWFARGYVPVLRAKRVAQRLNESIWALNYAALAKIFPKAERPTWKKVVEGCKLSRKDTEAVLFLKPPTARAD